MKINVSRYLKDNASVDAICSTLREVCPSLYRSEDATLSKVFIRVHYIAYFNTMWVIIIKKAKFKITPCRFTRSPYERRDAVFCAVNILVIT